MTPKQERFVAEYLENGLNATKAAISAGYSPKSAEVEGSRLLRSAKVADAIAQRTGKAIQRLEARRDYSLDRVLDAIHDLAFFDPADLFEDDGSVKLMKDIPPSVRRVIAGLEVSEIFDGQGEQKTAIGLMKKIKVADRRQALDMFMRYYGAYKDKVEHTGKDGGPVEFVVKSILEE